MFQEVARLPKNVKYSDANITLHNLLLLELPIQQNRTLLLIVWLDMLLIFQTFQCGWRMLHHNFFLYFRLIQLIFLNNIIQLLSQKKKEKEKEKKNRTVTLNMKTNITNTAIYLCGYAPNNIGFCFYLNRLPKVDLLCRLYMLGITHNIKRPHKNPKPKIQFAFNFGRKILWDINLTKVF